MNTRKIAYCIGGSALLLALGCAASDGLDEAEAVGTVEQATTGPHPEFDAVPVKELSVDYYTDLAASNYALFAIRGDTNKTLKQLNQTTGDATSTIGTGFTSIDFVDDTWGLVAAKDGTRKICTNAQNPTPNYQFDYPAGVYSVKGMAAVPTSGGGLRVVIHVPGKYTDTYREGTVTGTTMQWNATPYCAITYTRFIASKGNYLMSFTNYMTQRFNEASWPSSSCAPTAETFVFPYQEHAYTTLSGVNDSVVPLAFDFGNSHYYVLDTTKDASGPISQHIVRIPANQITGIVGN